MDDTISRQSAIDALKQCYCGGEDVFGEPWIYEEHAIKAINTLPSAQPEIIRCKECKYSEHWYKDKRRCFLWHEAGIDVFEDGYCNYAERKDNG